MDTRVIRKVTGVGFILLAAGLFYYQIIKGNYYLERSRANYIRVIPQDTIRGSILDRTNTALAFDKPTFSIAVIPYQIRNKKRKLFYELSRFLGKKEKDIAQNYRHNIKSLFSPTSVMDNVSKEKALRIKEHFGDDVMIKEVPVRFYPFSYEFSHIIGYVKKAEVFYDRLKNYGYTPSQRVGFLGIEQFYDSYLRGEDGGKLVEVDSHERIVGFLGEQLPRRGKDIVLTIDSRMQRIAYEALEGYRGVIILMDSNNGEIYVMCIRPSYDLNRMIKGKGVNRVFSNPAKPLINRAIQSSYPLGSVFKPIMAIAGLEEKVINKKTIFNCPGYFMLAGTKFSCWDIHGPQNVSEAIAHSCNVYFYNLGLRLGIDKISRWAKKFGLNRLTGIDLPYEKRGFVPTPKWKRKYKDKIWFTGDTVNISIGQGYLKATPLEALVAINVFANGGYIVMPHLIKKVGDKETLFVRKDYLNISPSNLRIVKKALREVVSKTSGTAHLLSTLSLGIAGKTGTAQNIGRAHGWFVGFFPYHNPKYSICVFLENAGSSHKALDVMYKFLSRLKSEGLIKI